MIPSDLTYDFPEAAYLLLATPVLLWLFWRLYVYRQKNLHATALAGLIAKRSTPLFWIRVIFFLLAWIFGVLALMQPKGNERYPQGVIRNSNSSKSTLTLQRKGHDIILLIDASASMNVADARNKTTRLSDAKEIGDEFISRLKGENIAVYAFTSEPSKISPLTLDYLFARLMLKDIQINEGGAAGTDLTKVLTKVRDDYFPQATPRLKTVVLISDGGDTAIESLSGAQKEESIGKLLSLLQNAEALNLRVYAIGVGSQTGGQVPGVTNDGKAVQSVLDESLLKRISGKGRGQYYEANQLSVVDMISRLVGDMAQDTPFVDENTVQRTYSLATDQKIYTHYYYWPLLICLICLLIALFLPETSTSRWLAVLLLSTTTLQADSVPPYVQEKMNHAIHEAEAGAYREALDDYRSLVDLPLESWQRSILQYNQATLLLAEKKWQDAIQLYVSIPDSSQFPLLQRRLYTNLAIAQLELGKEILKNPQSARKAQFLMLRAQESLNQALKADCAIEKWEGSTECPVPFDIQEISYSIRQNLSLILKQIQKERLSNSPLEEGIALLYRAIDQLDSQLKMEEAVDHPLKENYKTFVVAEGDSWLPLWNGLKDKIKESKNLAIYEEARKLYNYAIRFVEKNKTNLSQGGIAESRQRLDEFVKAEWGSNTFDIQLNKFANHFKAALDQNPLALLDVIAVNDELSQLLKQKQDQTLQTIQKNLEKTIQYLQSDKQIQGRMFALYSQQMLRKLLKPAESNPDQILQTAIDQQQNALSLNMLFLLLETQQRSEETTRLVQSAQQETLSQATPYLKAVREEQIKRYDQLGLCQCKPWDEVLPLFNSGYREAIRSLKQLVEHSEFSNLALISQEQTVKDWEAALNKMNKKTEQEKPKNEPQQDKKTEQQPQDQEQKNQQLPNDSNAILQALQDMQRADIKPKGPQKVTIEGVKPW